jgi:hypothetical protein
VIIYERPTIDRMRRIHHMVEATTPRWTFEGGMRETAREALALLWHEAEELMEQSQYRHSQAMPEKELKLSWCPWEIVTTSGASPTK